MKLLHEHWSCIYPRTRANTRADTAPATLSALFRPQKTYSLLSEGSKSPTITLFLFPELNSTNNTTMLKKLPDHFKRFHWCLTILGVVKKTFKITHELTISEDYFMFIYSIYLFLLASRIKCCDTSKNSDF